MKRLHIAFWGMLGCLLVSLVQPAAADDSAARLLRSVLRLNTWLVSGETEEGWRRSLRLNVLETQAGRGYHADPAQLRDLLSRFRRVENVHPAFRDVANALAEHLAATEAAARVDISSAIASGAAQFRQTPVAELEQVRDEAVYLLRVMDGFYASSLSNFENSELRAKLPIREISSFLDAIEFELPPEDSAGKVATVMLAEQAKMNRLVEQRDALPLDREEDRNRLQGEIDKMQAGLDTLAARRSELQGADRPRLLKRVEIGRQLQAYGQMFESVAPDFQDAYFASAQAAFERFNQLFIAATDDNLENRLGQWLEQLAVELGELDANNSRLAATRVGSLVGRLENAGQVTSLAAAIRKRYSQPNLRVQVSQRLVREVASQPVNQSQTVAEMLLGRFIQGIAYTSGEAGVELVPNPNEAQLSIRLLGNVHADTFTKQGPITAYAGSNAMIEARRSIFAGTGGLVINQPYGAANLQSEFRGVSSRLRLIQRIAERQYQKDKYLAEGISAGRVEQRFIPQFREQTDQQLADGRSRLREVKGEVISSASLFPAVELQTTSSHLLAAGTRSTTTTLAAPSGPGASPIEPEIGVRVHESLASNYLDPVFAGKTFAANELGEQIAELLGEAPAALQGEDWSITFAAARPIQFEFEDNRFRVTVNGRRFEQDGTEIAAALEIRLKFRIEQQGEQLRLARDGDAVVEFVDPDERNAKTVGFKGFLEKKLNEVPEDGEGLTAETDLPANLIPVDEFPELGESPVARNLKLVQCRAEQGWFFLGWNHDPNGTEMAIVDLPAIVRGEAVSDAATVPAEALSGR